MMVDVKGMGIVVQMVIKSGVELSSSAKESSEVLKSAMKPVCLT